MCGLAHRARPSPVRCDATLPFAAPVGMEWVSQAMGFVLAKLLRWPRSSSQPSSWCSSGVLGQEPCPRWMLLCASLRTWTPCSFAAAGEVVGMVAVFSAGVLVPDLKDHSSRVFVSLSAVHLCSPVGCMHYSGTWNLPAAIACAFCFQSLLAAMLAACFHVPGLLFKGMKKNFEKRKIASSFPLGLDLPQASCLIRVEGHPALASAELEEGHESFNNNIPWDDVSDAVVTESPEYQCAAAMHLKVPAVLSIQVPGKRNTRSSLSSFSSKGRSACQRPLSEDVWRRFCRKSLARMVLDVYAMMNGKILDSRSTLRHCGITHDCTVHIRYRLRRRAWAVDVFTMLCAALLASA